MKKIALAPLLLLLAISCNFLSNNGSLGVLKTVDGGGVWQTSNVIKDGKGAEIKGLVISEMAFDPNNHEHLYVSSINSGFWRSFSSGDKWEQVLSKINAYDFFLNPNDLNNIVVAGTFGDHGKIIRTRDGGTTWEEIYNEASTKNPVTTITANPNNPYELYAALNSGIIIKSIDGGTNWFVVNDAKTAIVKLRYSKLTNTIYALETSKGLYKSTDGGIRWTSLTDALTGEGQTSYISKYIDKFYKLALDDEIGGVMYVTTSSGLYKTSDDGKSWFGINLPVNADSEDPRAIASTHGGVLAYTSIGSTVYKTLDGGKSWQTQGVPTNNLINKILIDPVLSQVTYAGLAER